MNDPARISSGEAVFQSDNLYMSGPILLRQCSTAMTGNGEEQCDITVEKAFIGSLPVLSKDHTNEVDGVEYNRWGSDYYVDQLGSSHLAE